jgi:uncharacterized protein (DUF58 family)
MKQDRSQPGWHHGAALGIAAAGAVVLVTAGAVLARPDTVMFGLPFAVWLVLALRQRERPSTMQIEASQDAERPADEPHSRVRVHADVELVDLWVLQGRRHRREVIVTPAQVLRASSTLLHSGPARLLDVRARALGADGALISDAVAAPALEWNAPPRLRPIGELALGSRLGGLHGAHAGRRPGAGGDFRDIHPFAPGDEVRRVDWRATARLGRRPGELYVRRTQAMSEATILVVLDIADDLGQVVATWGSGDEEQSGPTSLDLGREAARALTESALDRGDRVQYQELATAGRIVRTGSGARQRARVLTAISAARQRPIGERYRRSPLTPPGATVYVLSTFFDGSAAALAAQWRAGGHRVIAVDILPEPDLSRLSASQQLAARTLFLERANTFADFTRAGITVLTWSGEGFAADLAAARRDRVTI